MSVQYNLVKFHLPLEDLVTVYVLYIRSVLEQSAVVWHSSITKGEQLDLERVQKCALRIILGEQYTTYEESLIVCGLDRLKSRRTQLCLNFALKCVKNDKTSDIFPLNNQSNTRHHEKFQVTNAKTERLSKSAISFMQKLLNKHEKSKKKS